MKPLPFTITSVFILFAAICAVQGRNCSGLAAHGIASFDVEPYRFMASSIGSRSIAGYFVDDPLRRMTRFMDLWENDLFVLRPEVVLMMIWLALSGYICLGARAPRDVVEPSHINHNVRISTPAQQLQYDCTHLSPTLIGSTWKCINALYNPDQQHQDSNYIQTFGVVVARFGGFVSESRAFTSILFLSFNLLVSVRAQYVNCTGYGECGDETITCDQGHVAADCIIDCIGTNACYKAHIYGGARPLFINCHGKQACWDADIRAHTSTLIDAQGYRSFRGAGIRCNTTEYCNITAQDTQAMFEASIYANIVSGTKLFVNATGPQALQSTYIRCPIDNIRGDSYSNDAVCNIYAQGDEVMKGTKIYAVESFYNAHIECDAPQTTISNPNVYNSVLLCAEFEFDQFCELECPQNGIGIEFVDESNCFCADYMIPTPQPTHNPTMLPTTSSPTFSPTKYDPKEESPNVLYVSKNGCDAGPCDSDRYVDEPHCLKDQTNVISSKCTSNNTLLFNVTGVVTVTHSVTEDAYDYCPTHPHCSDDYVRNEG
eukprot:21778_1